MRLVLNLGPFELLMTVTGSEAGVVISRAEPEFADAPRRLTFGFVADEED